MTSPMPSERPDATTPATPADLPTTTRQVHLARRPHGEPTPDDFAVVEVPVPALEDGQVLVRNVAMSVDPYMRGRMDDTESYVAPFAVGEVMEGGAVGEVIASRADAVPVGAQVLHFAGWREHAVLPASAVQVVEGSTLPLTAYLGAVGMTGLTAYAGLMRVAAMKPGDTVFVSGAAGAVGSLVGQIAKLSGAARVVGSAGSPAKVKRLLDLGFDAAFDYHDGVREGLREAAPDGIDVYFDNVGGDHLEAAIGAMNRGGRIAVCGMISQYNATEPVPGPRNLTQLISKRLRIEGFLVNDHSDLAPQFRAKMAQWVGAGQIHWDETKAAGIENAAAAFIAMLGGANTGKMLVLL